MVYPTLFILVEGNDDERFFANVISPILLNRYDYVQIWTYRQETRRKLNSFLKSIDSMGADYIFVSDIDDSPCVTSKKLAITASIERLKSDRILVVKREIESWYLAGLNDDCCEQIGISSKYGNTESHSKERFLDLMPGKFNSKVDFMQEILKLFHLEAV